MSDPDPRATVTSTGDDPGRLAPVEPALPREPVGSDLPSEPPAGGTVAQSESSEFAMAEMCRAEGDLPAALTAYERALEQAPTNVAILGRIADVEFELGAYGEAQLRYREALALAAAPPPWAHIGIANAAERLGDLPRALAHLREAASLSPTDIPLQLRFLRAFEQAAVSEQRRHAGTVVEVIRAFRSSRDHRLQDHARFAYDLAVAAHLLGNDLSDEHARFYHVEQAADRTRLTGWFCDARSPGCAYTLQLFHDDALIAETAMRLPFRHGRVGGFELSLPESVRDVPTEKLELRIKETWQRLSWTAPDPERMALPALAATTSTPVTAAVEPVRANMELAWAWPSYNATLVAGWGYAVPGGRAWLESARGSRWALLPKGAASYFYDRPDVRKAYKTLPAGLMARAGFLTLLEQGPAAGEALRLKSFDGDTESVVDELIVQAGPARPLDAARLLHDTAILSISDREYVERVGLIDRRVLDGLIAAHQADVSLTQARIETFGRMPSSPAAAIVIPLYGQVDFIEHQLAEFARDPHIREHGEVVYVIDDPAVADELWVQAPTLYRLYRVPFRLVDAGANRGYAAANNLGVASSVAPIVVFLNSDAFPKTPGWARALCEVLASNPELGAVGPRLLYPTGGIQHAGMEFRWRREWRVWVNHHPYLGLDPSLDPHTSLTEVQAVTAACLAMRREHFVSVGGFDTGYLIGDFEDSDLCLKLRRLGLKIGYLPSTELIHLERQSFRALGEGSFRFRVTLFNAARHQARWASFFDALPREEIS